MDDLLTFGASKTVIDKVLQVAFIKVKLKELGLVTTFLGMEISLEKKKYKRITLYQTKYIKKILNGFQKGNLVPSNTPIVEGIKFQKVNSNPLP